MKKKTTSYVMWAIAVAGMVAILADRVSTYMDRDKITRVHVVDGERQTRVLPLCRVVSLEWKQFRSPAYRAGLQVALLTAPLRIVSAEGEQGSLSYVGGLADAIAMHADADTLHITLDFPKAADAEKILREGGVLHYDFESMVLALPENVRSVCADVGVCIDNVRRDSLCVRSEQAITVQQSQFGALRAQGMTLDLQSGSADHLYLDITDEPSLEVGDDFLIGTEHLTAGRSAFHRLRKGECRQVVWEPQTDDARLELSIRGRGRFVFDR